MGQVEKSFEMLMNMKKMTNSLKLDVYSYTFVMDGLCKVGRFDEARGLLNETDAILGLKTKFNYIRRSVRRIS